jgi:Zn-dependent metalloprotease
MASGFNRFSFVPVGRESRQLGESAAQLVEGDFDTVARTYVTRMFAAAKPDDSIGAARRALTEVARLPQEDAVEPALILKEMQEASLSNTVVVKYQQAVQDVPVHGADVAVEMTPTKSLVSLSGQVSAPRNLNPIAKLSPSGAYAIVKRIAGIDESANLGRLAAPRLLFRFDDLNNVWTLCYLVKHVRIKGKPQHDNEEWDDCFTKFNFFIDASTGEEVARVPVRALVAVSGPDAGGTVRTVEGKAVAGEFVLIDDQRNIRTHSLGFEDINCGSSALPGADVTNATTSFTHRGAIAAHYNAGRVYDFYREVLQRRSIDNRGMAIISSVDCLDYKFDYQFQVCRSNRPQPVGNVWRNAAWVGSQMVYGQALWTDGSLRSYAESLDVVAHEITHGVTERTADLEYRTESGALNESYSDILGIAIANYGRPLSSWDWSLGVQINGGVPLRRLDNPSDPSLNHPQPSHMRDFRRIPFGGRPDDSNDYGHVHGNSGIHNKAAFNLFNALGGYFTPTQVVALFYSTLTVSLTAQSTFADSKQGMLDRCRVLFAGSPDLNNKITSITQAFDAVGI